MRVAQILLAGIALLAFALPPTRAQAQLPQLPQLPGGLPFIPVGPQPPAVPVNSEGWRSVVAEFGPPMQGRQARIVEDVVAELSRAAGPVAPKGGYRATLLDTSVVNAFAIGDGNVFMTRQLLAYMNDEDDLLAVMGHEVGHVIGGHSRFKGAAQAGRAGADQLLGVFLPPLRGAVQMGGAVVVNAFSRSQEHAADVAGVKFLADLGRNPHAMGRALRILDADAKLQRLMFGGQPPDAFAFWLSSHPMHGDRMNLVQLAANMAPRAPAAQRRSAAAFVRELDGMVFEDSAAQGIVDGGRFRHPTLKFALDAAPGLRLLNGSSALMMRGPGGSAATLKMVNGPGDPAARFKAAWVKSFPGDLAPPAPVVAELNGLPTASGFVDTRINDTTVRISMSLHVWSDSQSFIYAAVDPRAALAEAHAATSRSLRRLSEAEAAAVKLRRLSVVEIAPGDSVASLARRMAYEDFREERFRLINGLADNEPLPKSGPVKIVVWAAP
jgi:predicted Zn-dependent protease